MCDKDPSKHSSSDKKLFCDSSHKAFPRDHQVKHHPLQHYETNSRRLVEIIEVLSRKQFSTSKNMPTVPLAKPQLPHTATNPTTLTAFPPPPSPSDDSDSSDTQTLPTAKIDAPPAAATDAVLVQSVPIPAEWESRRIRGLDFNDYLGRDIPVSALVEGMRRTGFQASNLTQACDLIDEMVILRFHYCARELTTISVANMEMSRNW